MFIIIIIYYKNIFVEKNSFYITGINYIFSKRKLKLF